MWSVWWGDLGWVLVQISNLQPWTHLNGKIVYVVTTLFLVISIQTQLTALIEKRDFNSNMTLNTNAIAPAEPRYDFFTLLYLNEVCKMSIILISNSNQSCSCKWRKFQLSIPTKCLFWSPYSFALSRILPQLCFYFWSTKLCLNKQFHRDNTYECVSI